MSTGDFEGFLVILFLFIMGLVLGFVAAIHPVSQVSYERYYKGEIVCETRLSGEIECIKRKDVK